MASKGRRAAAGLSMLVKTTRGVEAVIIRKAVHACILPIFTYVTPAWWPGRTRTNSEGWTIQNGMESNCKKLDKAQNKALRGILPVWRITPIVMLQRETATRPLHHTLDYLCEIAALHLNSPEVQNPLRIRTKQANTTANPSRLEKLARKCSNEIEYLDPLHEQEPWEKYLFGFDGCLIAKGGEGDREKAAVKFNGWLKS